MVDIQSAPHPAKCERDIAIYTGGIEQSKTMSEGIK